MTDARKLDYVRHKLREAKAAAVEWRNLYEECNRQREDACRIVGIVQTERNTMIAAWREFAASDKGPEALEKLNQPFR